MKFKCIQSFDIEDRKKGTYTVNKGEIWELYDAHYIIFKRNGIGIGLLPWHVQSRFEEVRENK